MTNEELAVLIKQGRSDLYAELWSQVRGFISVMALRRILHISKPSEADADDLIQSGYLALVETVRAYDPERGAFNTILGYHLRRAFNEACGVRTERAARDPIHSATSLDVPANTDDPDGETWGDLIPGQEDPEQTAVDCVYREQLRLAEERLLNRISVKGADIIRSTILDGESLSECAKRYNSTETSIRGMRDSYLSSLRSMARSTPEGQTLRGFIEEHTDYYKMVSVKQFNRTHTSAPEELTLYREQLAGIYRTKVK